MRNLQVFISERVPGRRTLLSRKALKKWPERGGRESMWFHDASSRRPLNSRACSELMNHHINGGNGSRDGGGDGGE